MLGTPVGQPAFLEATLTDGRRQHDHLLQRLPLLKDLQAEWLLLSYCANARANYTTRTLPPHATEAFARAHDDSLWSALDTLLGGLPPCEHSLDTAKQLASLPRRLGGLGLRSAARGRAAAWWASWADALPVLNKRLPRLAQACLDLLRLAPNK